MYPSSEQKADVVARARRLCQTAECASFSEFSAWFRHFFDVTEDYVHSDQYYQNPNHIIDMQIIRAEDNVVMFPVL
jgi:hypothetical protein